MTHTENQVSGGLDAGMGSREVDGIDSNRTGPGDDLQARTRATLLALLAAAG